MSTNSFTRKPSHGRLPSTFYVKDYKGNIIKVDRAEGQAMIDAGTHTPVTRSEVRERKASAARQQERKSASKDEAVRKEAASKGIKLTKI